MQEQYTGAVSHLQQLVHQQPSDYAALAQLLTLLRRVGRAEEGQGFLHLAQEHASRAAGAAGANGNTCLPATLAVPAETEQHIIRAAYDCPLACLHCKRIHPHAAELHLSS